MQILRPGHNIPATKVRKWKEIEADARRMRILAMREDFEGQYSSCYAIAHGQVSREPEWFFVINEEQKDENDKNIAKQVGSWCVINAEILETKHLIRWQEACMTFPHRQPKKIERYNEIKVKYQIPSFGGRWLWWRTKTFTGVIAFMFQHEQQHQLGENIYGINNQKI